LQWWPFILQGSVILFVFLWVQFRHTPFKGLKFILERCNHYSALLTSLATIVLVVVTIAYVIETQNIVSLTQDPVIYITSPDNKPFLYQDSTGDYPVLITNSGHTGVKDVKFHYSLKAMHGTKGSDNLLISTGPSLSHTESIKINAGETISYKLDLNNKSFNEYNFSFNENIVHIDFFYVKITYRRELDNKFFYTEKIYMIPNDGDKSRLAEAEWADYFTPSKDVIRGVQNIILLLLRN
jgi:hypothetical protein